MTKNQRHRNSDYRIVIRGVRRKRPDVTKFAKAVIDLALQEAAREAEARRSAETSETDVSPTTKTRKEAA